MSDEIAQLAAKVDVLNSRARDGEAAPPVHKPPPKKLAPKPVGHEPASAVPLPAEEEKKQ
jgi:hypothetical protein